MKRIPHTQPHRDLMCKCSEKSSQPYPRGALISTSIFYIRVVQIYDKDQVSLSWSTTAWHNTIINSLSELTKVNTTFKAIWISLKRETQYNIRGHQSC